MCWSVLGCLLRVFECARVFINCARMLIKCWSVLGCLLNVMECARVFIKVLECARVFIKGVRVC